MKICIILYSHTGHTRTVTMNLRDRLLDEGHSVTVEELRTVKPLHMSDTIAELTSIPSVSDYDALVLACPVRGGTPAPAMRLYLEQVPSLKGHRVACLVTGIFPAGWGRNQTLAQMNDICEAKGAYVSGAGSVGWLSLGCRRQIANVVADLSELFQSVFTMQPQ